MSKVIHYLKRKYYKYGSPDFPDKHTGWNWNVFCENLDNVGTKASGKRKASEKRNYVTCKRCLAKLKKEKAK